MADYSREMDPVLLLFLEAREEKEAYQLERLIAEMQPVVRGIIRQELRVPTRGTSPVTETQPGDKIPAGAEGETQSRDQTADDAEGEVFLRVITRLKELKRTPSSEAIQNFRGFVAVETYRVCRDTLRRRSPQRTKLKRKILYLLMECTTVQGIALWSAKSGQRLCGFSEWQGQEISTKRGGMYQQLLDDPRAFMRAAQPERSFVLSELPELLEALFNGVGGPIELNDVVRVSAELLGIQDRPDQTTTFDEDERTDPLDELPDLKVNVARTVELRELLGQLWEEIKNLPRRQRVALLLNLRDSEGRGVIALLPILEIASVRQIAAVLEMTAEQFATLARDLPIADDRIGELLDCTRQQVINLRKVARQRLARRVRALGWDNPDGNLNRSRPS